MQKICKECFKKVSLKHERNKTTNSASKVDSDYASKYAKGGKKLGKKVCK